MSIIGAKERRYLIQKEGTRVLLYDKKRLTKTMNDEKIGEQYMLRRVLGEEVESMMERVGRFAPALRRASEKKKGCNLRTRP